MLLLSGREALYRGLASGRVDPVDALGAIPFDWAFVEEGPP